ncbi:uncharacterized protein isoform X1 [Leptinotarsa decemlineata]|uniref:uncharacterized protein isoform X1 n=1 Tax=Leptinotarsa decemlineata TaxID=7539 RepID=UPI003D308F50
MTEMQIFKILLKEGGNNKTFDYPKQQKDSADIIAKNLTNIIYDSLKQKSSASNIKRRNVLKFLNIISEVKEQHSSADDWIQTCLSKIRKTFENVEVCKLLNECNDEFRSFSSNTFPDNMIKYHEMKNIKRKKKKKYLDFIKERDQLRLNSKYDIQVVKKISHYEVNENLIKSFAQQTDKTSKIVNTSFPQQTDDREKQIKLAYALLNVENRADGILEGILFRLASYTVLTNYEQTFLQNLFDTGYCLDTKIAPFMDLFFFVLEKIILEHATNLVCKENELDVCQYYVNLEGDYKFLRLREICRKNDTVGLKLKTLIYELYCMSCCNENVLKLIDLIL